MGSLRRGAYFTRISGHSLGTVDAMVKTCMAFVSTMLSLEQLRERLVSCADDIERFAATSDHAALLVDLRLPLTHVVLHA